MSAPLIAVAYHLDAACGRRSASSPGPRRSRGTGTKAPASAGSLAVDVGQTAAGEHQPAPFSSVETRPVTRAAAQHGAGHRVQAGAARRALDEHALVVVHAATS